LQWRAIHGGGKGKFQDTVRDVRIALLFLLLTPVAGADWNAVERVDRGEKIEIQTRDGERRKATFVSATADSVVVRDGSGERSVGRGEVKQLWVHDAGRRVRRGVLWTLVGAGIGAGLGVAVCPGCGNEGNGGKFVGPGVAIGAGVGALGFLSSPYKRLYKAK
jgi:hypothetical protein